MKPRRLLTAIIVSAVIAFAYIKFEEWNDFRIVNEERTTEICDKFIEKHPKSSHTDSVAFLRTKLAFYKDDFYATQNYIYDYRERFPYGAHIEDIDYLEILCDHKMNGFSWTVIDRFNELHPSSKYKRQIDAMAEHKWNECIASYDTLAAKAHEKAASYLREMLTYLKEHKTHTVGIVINPDIRVKDYADYSSTVHMILDNAPTGRLHIGINTVKSKIVHLGDNFSERRINEISKDIISSIQSAFNDIFGFGTIQLSTNAPADAPTWTINYKIRNLETKKFGETVPELYEIYTGPIQIDPDAVIVGTQMSIYCHLTLPDSDTDFKYNVEVTPENALRWTTFDNGDGNLVSQAYYQITRSCLDRYITHLKSTFALPTN